MDESYLTLARARGGGDANPHELFWNGRRTAERIAMKFCVAYRASFEQLLTKKNWPGKVRSPSYDVIRGTASGRLFNEIVFSATGLAAIDWNGDIMHDLGQHMTKCDLWHCIMTFQRSSEVTDLD